MAMQEFNTQTYDIRKWIVGFRLEKAVPQAARESIVNWMTIDNQNQVLATLMALWTKPKTMLVNGKKERIPHELLVEENLEHLNLIDEDIAYILDRTSGDTPQA